MSCVDRFYAIVKKDIFLTEKAVKQFFIYFFNDEGASSYLGFNNFTVLWLQINLKTVVEQIPANKNQH